MFKKILLPFLFITTIFFSFTTVTVAEESIAYPTLFIGDGCGHCARVEAFIRENNIEGINKKEIYHDEIGRNLFQKTMDKLEIDANKRGVPFMILKDEYIVGDGPIIDYLKANYEIQNTSSSSSSKIGNIIPVTVFIQETCKHCHAERDFLNEKYAKDSSISITYLDVAKKENEEIFEKLAKINDIPMLTPITVIGDRLLQGYDSKETTGATIKDILFIRSDISTEPLNYFLDNNISLKDQNEIFSTCDKDDLECTVESKFDPGTVNVPLIGVVKLKDYTLPTLSIILGFVDGFNPCAMWVLVTFLIVLIKIGNRKKMFQIAGLFILAEAVMYYFILEIWFTAWNFIKFSHIVTPIIGIVAISGGIFFLYEFFTNKGGECTVTNMKQKARISKRIKELASKPMTFVVILGILGLAFSVNIIEFVCSIGIPQTFTKIVEMNNLSFWYEQFLLGLYILFYMIDDIIIFGVAIYGLDKLNLTHKYTRWVNLFSGIVIILLGLMLIFAPEMLTW